MVNLKHPKISVIIPTKKESKILERTLKQYKESPVKNLIEVIVSDANSCRYTKSIAKKYSDLVVLAQKGMKENIPIARNRGASVAHGEFLLHTDADVIIPDQKDFFKKVMEVFENPSVVAVSVPLKFYPEESRKRDKFFEKQLNFLIWLSFKLRLPLAKGECQIVRRDPFQAVGGYNPERYIGEDHELFFRLKKVGKIKYLRKLKVFHSPRRYKEKGYVKTSLISLREGLWLLFRRKNYLREWDPVR